MDWINSLLTRSLTILSFSLSNIALRCVDFTWGFALGSGLSTPTICWAIHITGAEWVRMRAHRQRHKRNRYFWSEKICNWLTSHRIDTSIFMEFHTSFRVQAFTARYKYNIMHMHAPTVHKTPEPRRHRELYEEWTNPRTAHSAQRLRARICVRCG